MEMQQIADTINARTTPGCTCHTCMTLQTVIRELANIAREEAPRPEPKTARELEAFIAR